MPPKNRSGLSLKGEVVRETKPRSVTAATIAFVASSVPRQRPIRIKVRNFLTAIQPIRLPNVSD